MDDELEQAKKDAFRAGFWLGVAIAVLALIVGFAAGRVI